MLRLYPVILGFLFTFMGVIYNIWGFLLPYIASKVKLPAETNRREVHLSICEQHLCGFPVRRCTKQGSSATSCYCT